MPSWCVSLSLHAPYSLSTLHQNSWAVMTMTTKISIIDELHAVREQMLADAGGTLADLVAKIQSDQAKSGRKILRSADNNQSPTPRDR